MVRVIPPRGLACSLYSIICARSRLDHVFAGEGVRALGYRWMPMAVGRVTMVRCAPRVLPRTVYVVQAIVVGRSSVAARWRSRTHC